MIHGSGSPTMLKYFFEWVMVYFVWLVQLLVLVFVLCPLVVVYLVGLYISTGISLWRLKHNYGSPDGMKKLALIVLYSLALAQGWFHGFKTLYARVIGVGLVEEVVSFYSTSMDDDEDRRVLRALVSYYRKETMIGCTKDPILFTRGRNHVTYAVELMMESKSSDRYLSGVQILGTILQKYYYFRDGRVVSEQADLVKQELNKSASFGHMIRGLIETMGTGVPPDSIVIREHAARIVAHVADRINLMYFPKGSQFLSFLFSTVEDYMGLSGKHSPERGRRRLQIKKLRGRLPERQQQATLDSISEWPESGSHCLVVQALRIIKNLSDHEDNRRIIINTEGVTSKISAPLISEQLHSDHHDEWSTIAELSLELMTRLMDDTGETGEMFRSKILSNHKEIVVRILQRIIDCLKCELSVKIEAMEIFLLQLSEDTPPSIMAEGSSSSSSSFIRILLLLFLRTKSSEKLRKLAGANLAAMLPPQIEGSATIMAQSVRVLVGDLTRELVDADKNISIRLQAAELILELLKDHTRDEEYLKSTEERDALSDTRGMKIEKRPFSVYYYTNRIWRQPLVLPASYYYYLCQTELPLGTQVLREILGYGSTREVNQTTGGPINERSSLQDIESGPVTQGNAKENTSSSHQQIGEQLESKKLQEALVSLCKKVVEELYVKDKFIASRLDEIAENICTDQGKPPKPFWRLVGKAEKLLRKEAEESASVRIISSG